VQDQEENRARLRPAWQAALTDTGELVATVANVANVANVASGGERIRRSLGDTAEALVGDVIDLAEGLVVAADHAARWVPGYAAASDGARRVENAILRRVRRRLDRVADTGPHQTGTDADPRVGLLNQLLADSLHTNLGRSRRDLHLRILRDLVPDEARILAAVSDGTRFPLLHIEVRGSGGVRTVLANACTVGRAAGVHLHSAVPGYISHLRELGVLEEGPKEESLTDQYALLANEDYVLRAIDNAHGGLRGTSEVRRTVQISALGAELWAACRPGEPAAPPPDPDGVSYRSAYAGAPPRPGTAAKP
jgi:hypothetical protein